MLPVWWSITPPALVQPLSLSLRGKSLAAAELQLSAQWGSNSSTLLSLRPEIKQRKHWHEQYRSVRPQFPAVWLMARGGDGTEVFLGDNATGWIMQEVQGCWWWAGGRVCINTLGQGSLSVYLSVYLVVWTQQTVKHILQTLQITLTYLGTRFRCQICSFLVFLNITIMLSSRTDGKIQHLGLQQQFL